MIVTDTNVISAIWKPTPDSKVLEWFNAQSDDLCLTAITVLEILAGLEEMLRGTKRRNLEASFEQAVREIFGGRILPFDERAARVAAHIYGARRERGIIVGPADTQIAGIAVSCGASIATRNVRHFPMLSIPVINPWEVS